jgi:hypothetical protein
MVIFLSPSESRLELVKHDVDSLNFVPHYPTNLEHGRRLFYQQHASYSNFYQDWLSSDTNLLMNKLKNKLAINMLCVDQQIKFVSIDSTELRTYDLARDLLHVGVRSNFIFSNIVINKLSV